MTSPSPKPASPSTLRRVLLPVVYVVGLLLIAELFYRFFWSDPPMTEVVYGNHPVFHHVPNAFLKSGLGEFDFRGRRYDVEKPEGRLRIAFIGDSFTYGFTDHDQTIPFHLDRKLRDAYPDADIEVLNFGFVSFSPIIETVVYRHLIEPLKPDVVIMLYDTFDPQDDVLYAKSATFDDTGMAISVAGEEFLKVGIRRSALVRFIQFAWEVIKNDWHYLPLEQRFESRVSYLAEPERFPEVIDYSFSTIERLARLVERNNSRFLLYHYPPPHVLQDISEFRNWLGTWGIGPDWQQPESSPFAPLVDAFCLERTITCYNFAPKVREMEESLKPHGSMLKIYNNRDGHFTGWANARFARFIFDTLKNEKLLPDPPAPADGPETEKGTISP